MAFSYSFNWTNLVRLRGLSFEIRRQALESASSSGTIPVEIDSEKTDQNSHDQTADHQSRDHEGVFLFLKDSPTSLKQMKLNIITGAH